MGNNRKADDQSGFLIRKAAVIHSGRLEGGGGAAGKDNTGRFIRTLGEPALL